MMLLQRHVSTLMSRNSLMMTHKSKHVAVIASLNVVYDWELYILR